MYLRLITEPTQLPTLYIPGELFPGEKHPEFKAFGMQPDLNGLFNKAIEILLHLNNFKRYGIPSK